MNAETDQHAKAVQESLAYMFCACVCVCLFLSYRELPQWLSNASTEDDRQKITCFTPIKDLMHCDGSLHPESF